MAALFAILLGAACIFYLYALVQFGREIWRLRSQRNRAVSVVEPFQSMPEFREQRRSRGKATVTVLPVNSAADRDVA
ncbi:MAG TPA: hypothetical protein VMB47_03885 [Candidatus Aquilonibacter sp.]|nr:hypothetical protein [Candidatus Aquilonibacter sp.]